MVSLKPQNNRGVTTISQVNHSSQLFVLRISSGQFNLSICLSDSQTGKSAIFLYSNLDHKGISIICDVITEIIA